MKRVMFYSTLYTGTFWAGCEKFWYDFVLDERVNGSIKCHAVLGRSAVTEERAQALKKHSIEADFYTHYTQRFVERNFYRVSNKVLKRRNFLAPHFKKIAEVKPDLVWFTVAGLQHVTMLEQAVQLCQSLNIPYWTIVQHAGENFFLPDKEELQVFARVFQNAQRAVFVAERNRFVVERAIGERLDNVLMSVNGLTADFLAKAGKVAAEKPPRQTGAVRFLNLARFSLLDKGQHLLFEALSGEKWRRRDWTLDLVGVDEEMAQGYVPRWIEFFNLPADRIKTRKSVSDVTTAIGDSDLLVLSSLAEGTPFAIAESMACGRPAVGTMIGGIPELIAENETGWLAEAATARHIDEALERAWQARDSWQRIGARARAKVVDEYNQEESVARLLGVLQQDLKN